MKKIDALYLPLIALASLSNSDPGHERSPPPRCEMPLPDVELLENFQGPVSGPFLLAGYKPPASSVSLLSMNIQNIPFSKSQNPDYRDDRADCLTKLAARFDAAAFQEDFLPRRIESGRRWSAGFKKSYIFKSSRPGLSFESGLSFNPAGAKPYSRCSGFFNRKSDCLASKGYQATNIAGVTIINTHLDAGRTAADQDARKIQLEELGQSVPANGPVLLVGDLNLYLPSQRDETMLKDFVVRHGLKVFMRYSLQKGHDFIMARDVDINWIGKVEDPLLSDHAGLVVNFSPPQKLPERRYASFTPAVAIK